MFPKVSPVFRTTSKRGFDTFWVVKTSDLRMPAGALGVSANLQLIVSWRAWIGPNLQQVFSFQPRNSFKLFFGLPRVGPGANQGKYTYADWPRLRRDRKGSQLKDRRPTAPPAGAPARRC